MKYPKPYKKKERGRVTWLADIPDPGHTRRKKRVRLWYAKDPTAPENLDDVTEEQAQERLNEILNDMGRTAVQSIKSGMLTLRYEFRRWLEDEYDERAARAIRRKLDDLILGVSMETITYIVQAGGFCKVGRTDNMKLRLASMQTNNPHKLEVRYVVLADVEEDLQENLQPYHHEREWFRWGSWIDKAVETYGIQGVLLKEPRL